MRIFVEVVERNGFGRAAQALQMAPASVSVQIANLEAHLGASLLHRTTRNVVPTDEGIKYYKTCKRVLDEISEVELSIGKSKSLPTGRLRVDAIDSYVINLIVPILPEFHERYPQVSIDFVQSGHVFDTSQTGVDVMIRMRDGTFEESSLVIKPLGFTQMICAASPEYLAEYGVPHTPHDLSQHNCLLWLDPLNGRLWEWVFQRDNDKITLDLPYAFAFSQQQARIDAAIRGLGITYELSCNIIEPVRNAQLRLVLEDWAGVAPQSFIIYDQSREGSAKVQAFVNFMFEKYPPGRAIEPPARPA